MRTISKAGRIAPSAFCTMLLALAFAVVGTAATTTAGRAETAYLSDYRSVEGTTAHAEPYCSVADLCGTLALRGGDAISVYAEAVPECEAPTFRIVRRRGAQVLLSYEVPMRSSIVRRQATTSATSASTTTTADCGARGADVAFDRGRVRMGVFLRSGGVLYVRFTTGLTQSPATVAPTTVRMP